MRAAVAEPLDTDPAPSRGALTLARIEARLAGTRPQHARGDWWVPGQTLERSRELYRYFPSDPVPAAVLVPIIDHPGEPTVLLTVRGRSLRRHAGQVSFPGGSIEAGDSDPAAAALRETREEIGLAESFVSVIGYLPDHLIISGFRVTPVVARVRPGFTLKIEREEVQTVFEAPLSYVFDPNHQRPRRHRFRDTDAVIELIDIPYRDYNIWGATAGMLQTLYRLCGAEDEHGRR